MSYAIVRNEKLTRVEAQGRCVHNDRKAKNHTNKDIAPDRTHLNYYLKENKLNYVKEFDIIRKENNLQGMIRSNSIIICELLITSDKEFFDKIGEEETKRYFGESYKFICNYKNLGEKNIVSAVVHLDEGVPHMHLAYIPVVHTEDKEGNSIEKICAKDFWKGRDSYRNFQNEFYNYITEEGFELKRGLPVEETGAKNLRIEELKQITNYEKTKKELNKIILKLPDVPNIDEISKISIKRDEKIMEKIIKPKDELIDRLFEDNTILRKELTRQINLVGRAEEYQNQNYQLRIENKELKNENVNINQKYKIKIEVLENENKHLNKIINTFEKTIHKFIKWICKKFDLGAEDDLVRDFEKETRTFIEPEKQIKKEEREMEWDMER